MKLRGRNVIVTGASSGIGMETAREFARAGSNVVLAAREKAELETLAEELEDLPGQRMIVPLDVSDREAVIKMVTRVVDEMGTVDILVNNAAQGLHASIAEGDVENMRRVMDVNFFGTIYAIQAVLPEMRRRGKGCIVNVSSVQGRIATPYNGIYSASKAALNASTEALRMELDGSGILVISIYPGLTDTPFQDNAIQEVETPPRSRLLRSKPASVVAERIIQAVRKEQREAYVTFGDAAAVAIKSFSPRAVEFGIRHIYMSSRGASPKNKK